MARTKQTARAGKKAQNQKQKSKGNKGPDKHTINQNKKFARKDFAKRKAARAKKAKLAAINETTAKIPSANLDTLKIPSADLDKLKARAARFGEISSKTLKQVSVIEKKQQRSDRFKSSTETDSETKDESEAKGTVTIPSVDLDKLKSRAARFGEISSKTLKKVSLIEQKQQRADRFKNTAVTDTEVTTDTSVANGKEA